MAPKGATAPGDGRGAAAAIVRPRSFKEGDQIEALDIQQLWYPARIVKSTAAQVRPSSVILTCTYAPIISLHQVMITLYQLMDAIC